MPASNHKVQIDNIEGGASVEGPRTGTSSTVVVDNREIIPLIFVPGVMGSRLETAAGKPVWDPDDPVSMLKNYGLVSVSAGDRKKALVGKGGFNEDYLTVMTTHKKLGVASAEEEPTPYKTKIDRGWAGLYQGSYGTILNYLESQKWPGSLENYFIMPVHAFGYNWSASNKTSGKKLGLYIDEVIQKYADSGRKCKKVILMTHSMGGLVARAACVMHGASDKVLGVLHGVQPGSGSGATAWRMKSGFERPITQEAQRTYDWIRSPLKMAHAKVAGRISAWTLGTDGEEVTSLLANMPGGLQLLPNKLYRDNENNVGWIVFEDKDGEEVRLPKSDPYAEIYREKDKFYRMIEPAWLDPGSKKKSSNRGMGPWDAYLLLLDEAESFHDTLANKVHPETVQFYSKDLITADTLKFTRELDTWTRKGIRLLKRVKDNVGGEFSPASLAVKGAKAMAGATVLSPASLAILGIQVAVKSTVQDSDWWINRGGFRIRGDQDDNTIGNEIGLEIEPEGEEVEEGDKPDLVYLFTILLPDGKGDGTVPTSSGKMLPAKKSFSIGTKRSKEYADYRTSWLDAGHEPIYSSDAGQEITSKIVTQFCIARLAEIERE